jgi:Family of unknown function (DUF6221)
MRTDELIALIEARLARDEALAQALAGEEWHAGTEAGDEYNVAVVEGPGGGQVARCGVEGLQDGEIRAAHVARHDPARALRRVKAGRNLVAAVLAEDHQAADDYFACSQAREGAGMIGGPTGPPGSGCSDPERRGKPCDCGRDARVARLLGIIAGEREAP